MSHAQQVLAHRIKQVPRVAALQVLVQGDALQGVAAVEIFPEIGPLGARV